MKKKTTIKKKSDTSRKTESPSRLIDARIKWRGVPVWSHDGLICTGETYKTVVKLTFFKGAQLKDPSRLFNSSLEGNARRAIDLHEGKKLDEPAFKALIRNAVALNTSPGRG